MSKTCLEYTAAEERQITFIWITGQYHGSSVVEHVQLCLFLMP